MSETPALAYRRTGGIVAVLLALVLSLSIFVPSALAANVNGNIANVGATKTVHNETSGEDETVNVPLNEQTIVGEGQNNNVVITNKTEDSPSPTGIFMANLPIFIISAFVVACVVVIVARAHKKAGEDDE